MIASFVAGGFILIVVVSWFMTKSYKARIADYGTRKKAQEK